MISEKIIWIAVILTEPTHIIDCINRPKWAFGEMHFSDQTSTSYKYSGSFYKVAIVCPDRTVRSEYRMGAISLITVCETETILKAKP